MKGAHMSAFIAKRKENVEVVERWYIWES